MSSMMLVVTNTGGMLVAAAAVGRIGAGGFTTNQGNITFTAVPT